MGECIYYNIVAGNFHTKNFVADFITIVIEFYLKTKNRFLPFGGLRGNIRTPYIARCKARGQLNFLFAIIELFHYLLQLRRAISGNLSTSAFFRTGWVTLSANFRRLPPTTVGISKLE